MNAPDLELRLADELRALLNKGLTSGVLMAPAQMDQHLKVFRHRFGPAVLRDLDGEALLRLMHGRQDSDARCLAYWMEFKNDDEFAGYTFGSIAGGSALKFGLYQRQADGAWIAGWPGEPKVLPLEDAIGRARMQRDELLAGNEVLAAMDAADMSDAAYARLQGAMAAAAPELHRDGWAHKYWFLIHPDRLDDYHSPRYQRFHLLKLLQMPPDRAGILDTQTPRFICAGRFLAAARELGVPVTSFNAVLNQRHGSLHRYWRIGTTSGHTGESQWDVMREGGFASIGWLEQVEDLSAIIGQDRVAAKAQIRAWLEADQSMGAGVASRKAGEILNFAQSIAENDLVLACDGQTVLGVGRVRGPYGYDKGLAFPHKRPVEWLLLESWPMPEREGLLTTVSELGKNAANLLELEQRLFRRKLDPVGFVRGNPSAAASSTLPLPPLDPITGRLEGTLQRKGQVVLYGPPGTGKTYRALRAARELAARRAFRKTFETLTHAERGEVEGAAGLVRVCTFHPGYGYEDFVEGLRPRTAGGQMVFEPRDGIFKRLCTDAEQHPDRDFFLVVDEFNRGDVPRVFGELLTVIEQDKRGMQVVLPVTGEPFGVPPNVFLIGTMNTADQSISLLDAALRRRFGFIELMPDSSQLRGRRAGNLPLGPWLDALNARLRRHLKRDARNLQIGHAYLMPRSPITSVAEFARVLRDDIVPLLEEYCYDDFATLRDILGSALVDVDAGRIRDEVFEPTQEERLVEALRFPEIEPFALAEQPADTGSAADASDPDKEDEDGAGPIV